MSEVQIRALGSQTVFTNLMVNFGVPKGSQFSNRYNLNHGAARVVN